jgi:glucosamine--fructose-6-phosphate aminotransferase (isomerizing)
VIDGLIPREIHDGPGAIRATLRDALAAAVDAASFLRERALRRVFVIGNGTSRHSALAASALYARSAGPDDPVAITLTAGDFRTYRPSLGPHDGIIGISASGEFGDVVGVFRELRGSVPTVAIVHVPDSTLTGVADRVVTSSGGPSHVPVMTKTFSATLVAAEITLLAMLDPDRSAGARRSIAAAADHAEDVIGTMERNLDRAVDTIARFEHVFVVGAGIAHYAALEAALKLKEIALVHAEGGETWEATSGAATLLDERALVIAIAPPGPGREATADLVRHARGWGAGVIEIAADRSVDGALLLSMPAAAEEDHATLTAVPPIALLAFALARSRGLQPDKPDWVARYHSQGLRHIIGVERPA